jgi:hypothetical protein
VLAGSLALALAARGRLFWSGLWLGVAVMTKQQGVLFAPLVVGALGVAGFREEGLPGRGSSRKGVFLACLAPLTLPILYWDSLRWAVAPSPWDLGATNVGGVALLPPGEWPGRAAAWGELAWWLLASPWAWGAYALALVAAALLSVRRRAPAETWLPALLLAAWAGGFLLLHVATSVQVWDRYLLPLSVPVVLLGGWATPSGGGDLPKVSTSRRFALLLALLLLLIAPPAWQAAQGQLPIGGDHGDYTGLNEALAAANVPGALLFHRELGWHARFALFDPVRSGAVQLRYYPSSVYLADSATKSPHKQRFVIVPDWAPLPDLPMQLALRGLRGEIAERSGHFTVYRIDERPTGDQSWRVCAPPVVYDGGLWERRDEPSQ